ncbi:MAG: alpha-mannosidase [Chthonomonadales bacterium]
MLKHPQITLARIERWVERDLAQRLWERQVPMAAQAFQPPFPNIHVPAPRTADVSTLTPGQVRTAADAGTIPWRDVAPGWQWGPIWSDMWFRFRGRVPKDWRAQEVVALIDVGAEGIVWEGDDPLQGIDANHREFLVTQNAAGGDDVELYVRANGMNPAVTFDRDPPEPPALPFTFGGAVLAVLNRELVGLYLDAKVALGVLKEQPADSPRYGQLLSALNEAVNLYDESDNGSVAACRVTVRKALNRPACPTAHQVSAIGHAHIDTAWLWPLERTQQKCIHTFATATRYMDLYPQYRFLCSQAQQYAWVKELAPKLYERIRSKVKAGQWEVAGSMWVEADCNISGGEALVRQILYGKRFWMAEFGIETEDLWLPDVFGYSAALPQILRKSGVRYFLTQKISWNQINRFPHHTFLWQGIDGTQVFTHFPPADTYNGMMTPRELAYNVRNFKDHDRATRSLYVFGFGDGGGGPTLEMIENGLRLRDVEGMPRVELEFARDFFRKAEAEARDLPVWAGELYLELHRGTYTTQARNKRANRKSEFLLRDAEMLACLSPAGLQAYPSADLERAWKLLLLNQFHDIIPGSSVREVYVDSAKDYQEIASIGESIVGRCLEGIRAELDTRGMNTPVLVVHTSPAGISEVVQVPVPQGAGIASARCGDVQGPVQWIQEDGASWVLFQASLPAGGYGYSVYDLSEAPCDATNPFVVTDTVMDNGVLRVELDENGLIRSIWDHSARREVIEPGARANRLELYEDKPLSWDAWDVDIYYREKGRTITELEHVEVLEAGPVRGAIRISRRFGNSRIVQTVRLARHSRRIEFQTEVDWHEAHKMLRVAFPVAVNSTRATYEIQYGHVERPTHANTSWDLARFEVAAQKWVDLSEGDYGAALLNDCKYGHNVWGNTLSLTLLRAPKAPDPTADMGLHQFTYALLPHAGDFRQGNVPHQAYSLNAPSRALLVPPHQAGSLPAQHNWFSVDRPGVFIEAVKKAEEEDAVVVRLYEAFNTRGSVCLKTSLPVASAHLCDLLERDQEDLPVTGSQVSFAVKPFEIVTIKLRLAR